MTFSWRHENCINHLRVMQPDIEYLQVRHKNMSYIKFVPVCCGMSASCLLPSFIPVLFCIILSNNNKKAELSQRWPCDAPYVWAPWKFESLTTHTATFPEFLMGFCSDWAHKCACTMQNLKSVALTVPGIIGGTRKFWAVPGYAHAPFFPNFLMGFYSDGPSECTG